MSTITEYPTWVQPRRLIRGDVKFIKAGDGWDRFIWTASAWIPAARAPLPLKQLSQKREKMVKDQESIRKTGL